jgi:hypothetical protein
VGCTTGNDFPPVSFISKSDFAQRLAPRVVQSIPALSGGAFREPHCGPPPRCATNKACGDGGTRGPGLGMNQSTSGAEEILHCGRQTTDYWIIFRNVYRGKVTPDSFAQS